MKAVLIVLLFLGSIAKADWSTVVVTPLPGWSYQQAQMPQAYVPETQPQAQVQVVVQPSTTQIQPYQPIDWSSTDAMIQQDLANSQAALNAALTKAGYQK